MITRIVVRWLPHSNILIKAPTSDPSWKKTKFSNSDHEGYTDESTRYWNPEKTVSLPLDFLFGQTIEDQRSPYNTSHLDKIIDWSNRNRLSLVVVASIGCVDDQNRVEDKLGFLFRKREHAMRFKLKWCA